MANVSLAVQYVASKNGAIVQGSLSKVLSMAGDELLQATQVIGNGASETLDLAELTGAPGFIVVQNLDAANYVELATDTGMTNKFAKILAGQFALFPPSSATIYAQANTAAVRVMVAAAEA